MSYVLRDEILSDDLLATVTAGLKFYEQCMEEELDEVITILENERVDESDRSGINFFLYVNPEHEATRKATKRAKRTELVGVKCGMCGDPILECNC